VVYPSLSEALEGGIGSTKTLRVLADWQQGSNAQGTTYQSSFTMPFAWIDKELFLHIGAVGSSYTVSVNGKEAGYVQYGNTPADFDVTQLAIEGKNSVIITRLTSTQAEVLQASTPPLTSNPIDCYVMAQPKMRIRDIMVHSAPAANGNGVLEIGIVVKTHALNAKTTRIYYELIAPDSTKVVDDYKDLTLDMRREDTVRLMCVVPTDKMWSAEHPHQYTLLVRSRYEGRINEYVPLKVGFRTISFDGGRLSINGYPTTLKARKVDGTCSSEELKTLKQQGYNTVYPNVGPFSRNLLACCDSLGLYVVGQCPIDTHRAGTSRRVGGNPSNDPQWTDAYVDRTEHYYHTIKNHPSVVAFSLANNSANGINLYESYLRLKALETERPILYLEGGDEWNSDKIEITF
jgi:beta-galactosidase